jgi:hypothetical protein
MALFFLIVLSAAVTAGFILAVQWAWREDRKTTLNQRFKQVIEGWGKEKD